MSTQDKYEQSKKDREASIESLGKTANRIADERNARCWPSATS
jgi:hypothetical protein